MSMEHDYLAFATNPNGVFGEFVSGYMKEQFPDQKDRLMIAVADVKSFLVEVAGIDPEMAEVVAARAAREIALSLDTVLGDKELDETIMLGSRFSENVSVDRAITNILNES